jgi:hypothetical protein
METAYSSETSLSTNKITQCKDSENCNLNNSIRENLKTNAVNCLFLQYIYPLLFSSTGTNEDINLWHFTYFWRHCVVIEKLTFLFSGKRR